MTLSRRDRCAMALALECCRADGDPADTLYYGGPMATLLAEAHTECSLELHDPWMERMTDTREVRLLNARIALLLRAMLRADRGDFGPWRCGECGGECERRDDHCYRIGEGELAIPMTPTRRIRPIWEIAPAHGGAR